MMIFSFKSFVRGTLVVSAITFSAILLFSLLSPFLPLADSVAHFRLYIMGALLLTVLSCLALGLKKSGLMSGGVFCAGVISIAPVMYHWEGLGVKDQASDLTIMQINVLFSNQTPEAVIQLIRDKKPDIVTLQEVWEEKQHIISSLKQDYPFSTQCHWVGFSTVVLSRFEEVNKSPEKCADHRGMSWMQVRISDQNVSIATIHLHWPYPYGQEQHIDKLKTHLEALPRPVIVAGDFNAAPWSHSVKRIETASEAKVIGGIRHSWSYRRKFPAILPIDHISIPSNMTANSIEVGSHVGSDHRPIIAKLSFKK